MIFCASGFQLKLKPLFCAYFLMPFASQCCGTSFIAFNADKQLPFGIRGTEFEFSKFSNRLWLGIRVPDIWKQYSGCSVHFNDFPIVSATHSLQLMNQLKLHMSSFSASSIISIASSITVTHRSAKSNLNILSYSDQKNVGMHLSTAERCPVPRLLSGNSSQPGS